MKKRYYIAYGSNLNIRQVRRYTKDLPNGKAYRKLAGEKVWDYVV